MAKRNLLRFENTERGFARAEFVDRYGDKCSLQASSLATEDCIWLGIDKVKPIILAKDAAHMGRTDLLAPESDPERMNGWVDWPLPPEVKLHSRMHLTRDMARQIAEALLRFADTGEIAERKDKE